MKLFLTSDPHRECWDMLPWVANDRLSQADAARIAPHLQECEACRAELDSQRRLREIIRAEEALVLAPQASFQKLMHRIDAHDSLKGTPSEQQQVAPRSHAPRWLAVAASIQAIAIALLLVLLWSESQERMMEPRFATLASPATVSSGPVIRIVFREQVSVAELNQLLRSLDAHIIAGPNTAGVFTLQLSGERATTEKVEAIAAELRSDERVLFSEPANAEIGGK
jgi:anti-sigma factor RsiW